MISFGEEGLHFAGKIHIKSSDLYEFLDEICIFRRCKEFCVGFHALLHTNWIRYEPLTTESAVMFALNSYSPSGKWD